MSTRRKVKRVLLMLDYGPEDPDSGEVYDLTALALEMLQKSPWSASIGAEVRAEKYWSERPPETTVSFSGNGKEWVSGATHLTDVVNAAMEDGDRVKAIKARAQRLKKEVQELECDAMVAKLEQVAQIRHQHPIARVTESPLVIPDKKQD